MRTLVLALLGTCITAAPVFAQDGSFSCTWGCGYTNPSALDRQVRLNEAIAIRQAERGFFDAPPSQSWQLNATTQYNIGNYTETTVQATNGTVTVTGSQTANDNKQDNSAASKTTSGNTVSSSDVINFK